MKTGRIIAGIILVGYVVIAGEPDVIEAGAETIEIHPVRHASLVLQSERLCVYIDPVGELALYRSYRKPDLVLITHVHGDHFQPALLERVCTEQTTIVAPPSVVTLLPETLKKLSLVLTNGQTSVVKGIRIEAIPAYNLTPERLKFHPRGRDNGYVLRWSGKTIYISGDTEDIPELRRLRDIDVAFICMNLPYTMSVEQAAEAVRAFRPRIVYPYHYRGSDLNRFVKLIEGVPEVEVRVRDWYGQ